MTLLTTDQLLDHISTDLGTDALQLLLDAAENDINEILGPVSPVSSNDATGTVNELVRVHGDLILLSRPAESIVQVIEGTTTLDPTDYELRSNGRFLQRLHDSTSVNPAWRWHHLVDVTYVFDDLATRKRVQIALVKLDLNHQPGASQETIGTWSGAALRGCLVELQYRAQGDPRLA